MKIRRERCAYIVSDGLIRWYAGCVVRIKGDPRYLQMCWLWEKP